MEIHSTNNAGSQESAVSEANAAAVAGVKADWSAPSLTRLSGKETEGKMWYSPIEFMGWSSPS